jgi:hypothetical protein
MAFFAKKPSPSGKAGVLTIHVTHLDKASRSRTRVDGDKRIGKSRNPTRAMPVSEATGWGRPRLRVEGERFPRPRLSGNVSDKGAANRGIHFSRPHRQAAVARYMNCQLSARLMLRSKLLRCVGPTRAESRSSSWRYRRSPPTTSRPSIPPPGKTRSRTGTGAVGPFSTFDRFPIHSPGRLGDLERRRLGRGRGLAPALETTPTAGMSGPLRLSPAFRSPAGGFEFRVISIRFR